MLMIHDVPQELTDKLTSWKDRKEKWLGRAEMARGYFYKNQILRESAEKNIDIIELETKLTV